MSSVWLDQLSLGLWGSGSGIRFSQSSSGDFNVQPGMRATGLGFWFLTCGLRPISTPSLGAFIQYAESWAPPQVLESKSPGVGPSHPHFNVSLGDLNVH